MFDYILFDLDGTLTDSSEGIVNSYKNVEKKMRLKYSESESIKKFIGPSIHIFFQDVHSLDGEMLGKAVTHYREYYTMRGLYENKLYEGVRELLESLQGAGKKIYLVTGKPAVYAKEVLRHFGIEKYFINVYGSELGISNQSKEELLQKFLDKEDAPADKCLMIGDRMHDIAGAKHHRIKSMAVTYGFGTLKELQECRPDYIINAPLELLDLLKITTEK
jgi:phosphoglycolate phosphatase